LRSENAALTERIKELREKNKKLKDRNEESRTIGIGAGGQGKSRPDECMPEHAENGR